MISVIVLGTGNVGTHLINAFLENSSIELLQVYSRRKPSLKFLENRVPTTTSLNFLKSADVYVIAVSDNAISELSSHLNFENKLVVHTSGASSVNVLKNNGAKGVFYPLQTFTKDINIDFKEIPICIETENENDLLLLEKLASKISDNVFILNSEQRKYIHMAAVFTNNFVNHLYKIGYDICKEKGIPFEILHPLIRETANKVIHNEPRAIQTGPAYRNDTQTISKHLSLLTEEKKKLYQLLTDSIKKSHGEKL